MRRHTPQKQDRKVSESTDVSGTDVASVAAVTPQVMPCATTAVSADVPVDGVSSTVSPAVTTTHAVAGAATKSKTPQTRKTRSRIAANFGALNSPSS